MRFTRSPAKSLKFDLFVLYQTNKISFLIKSTRIIKNKVHFELCHLKGR